MAEINYFLRLTNSDDKRRELFAQHCGHNNVIGYKEFEAVYATIQVCFLGSSSADSCLLGVAFDSSPWPQNQIVERTLLDYGFTKGRIILLLSYAVFLLILIFIFIFVGVAAFTGQGTLGAIVNSLLAAGAGAYDDRQFT